MRAAHLVTAIHRRWRAAALSLLALLCAPSGAHATPGAPDKRVGLRVQVDGGLAAWRDAASALTVDADRVVPEWVATAGGSSPWREQVPGLEVDARAPGPGGRLVGYSGLEADAEAAVVGARQEASRLLQALVLWRSRDFLRHRRADSARRALRVAAEQATVTVARLEKAVHHEEIERSYGRLHRAAVLIEARPEAVAELAAQLERDLRRAEVQARVAEEARWIRIGVGIALTVATLVALLVAEALTKGYFRWRLRALAGLVIGLVWFVLVSIPHWL